MTYRTLLAAGVVALACGLSPAETFLAKVVRIDGDKVTFARATFHRDRPGTGNAQYSFGKEETAVAIKDATVTTGHFLPEDGATTKGWVTGKTKSVAGGLGDPRFNKLGDRPSRPSLVTVADKGADKGKVTAVTFWASGSPK